MTRFWKRSLGLLEVTETEGWARQQQKRLAEALVTFARHVKETA